MNFQASQPAVDQADDHQITQVIDTFKAALIERTQIQLSPAEMAHDVPLFGDGLGLDSVDALLIALIIESEFGVAVSDDDIIQFTSLNDVANFVVTRGGTAQV